MKVIAYARVSTEDQVANGVSLSAQIDRLRAYARSQGWSLTEVVRDEGASAKNLNRPGLQRVLEAVETGAVEAVLVYKLDRLTRSVADLDWITRLLNGQDVALVSLSEHLDGTNAGGRLMMNLLAVVSQWEREAIAERTRTALNYKKTSGRVYGRVPFGYRRNGDRLEPLAKELEIVRRMHAWREEGASLREIARRLNAQGVESKHGGAWSHKTVGYILGNDLYEARGTA